MLGRPAPLRAAAKVVGPDDLVEKAVAPEDLVEQHLHVVHLARVQMQIERARRREHALNLAQTRFEELEVVVEPVRPGQGRALRRAVAATAEACAVAGFVGDDGDRGVGAAAAGVERRVGVDQIDRRVGQGAQNRQVVALDDAAQRRRRHPAALPVVTAPGCCSA